MRETIYEGKSYPEPDYDVQKAVAAGGLYLFRYFPVDRLIIVAEVTAERFACRRFYPNMPRSFAEDMVYDSDRAVFYDMYQAVENGEKRSAAVFKLRDGITIVRVVLSVLETGGDGKARIAVGMAEDVTEEMTREREIRDRERVLHDEQVRLAGVHRALSSSFDNVYLVNLADGSARSYSISDAIKKEYGDAFKKGSYAPLIQLYVKKSVYKPDQPLFDQIINVERLGAAVCGKASHTFNYRVMRDGRMQYFQCRAVKAELENKDFCVIAFRDINAEVIKELEQKTVLEEQVAVISGLSADYYSVMLVDYQKDTVRILRAKEGSGKRMGDFFSRYAAWSEGARAYTDTQVADDKEAFYEALSREGIMKHDADYSFNCKKITEDGYRYLQFKVAYVELESGYRIAIVGTKDVDEKTRREMRQKAQLEDALAKSQRYKRAVLAEAVIAYESNLSRNRIEEEMWEVMDGNRTELLSFMGMSVPADYEDFHKRWACRQVVPEYREIYEKNTGRAYLMEKFQKGHAENIFEFQSYTGCGQKAYLRHTIFMVPDQASGDIIAYCNVKNITEQKLKELQMHQYEQMFIYTAANIYRGVLMVALDTRKTTRLMVENGEIIVEDVGSWDEYLAYQLSFVHPDDFGTAANALSIHRFMRMQVSEKSICSYRSVKKNEAGNYRSFFTNTYMSEIEGRRYAVVVTIDNTKAVERELQQKELIESALARAEVANQAKTAFLSNMSHDIRTPMNAILGYTTLALNHIDHKEQVQDYLGKIMSAGSHLLSLINDVLDMSRIESGRIQLEEAECSLSEIMHELSNILQNDMKTKKLDFCMDAVEVLDENVICDRMRLNQVLLNLLGNAIKFTEPGGSIRVRICQKPSETEDAGIYEFHVKDTGIGMSEEFLKHIYEPFERERSSTVSGIQGTGLGMSITKNIVEMMDGAIQVKSRKGAGSEFIVEIPLQKRMQADAKIKIDELDGVRALAVGHEHDVCGSICSMLVRIGMRAEQAVSGKEALLKTKQAADGKDAYRVYVIDGRIPDMGGIETARQLRREAGDDALVIVLTAYDQADSEEDGKEAGVTAFCSKPLFLSDLRRCLLDILHPQKAEDTADLFMQEAAAGQRLLLVEDNDLNREIACEILGTAGFVIEEAENGKIALERLVQKGAGYYSLVLMDVQMPVMDGYEATKAVRALEDKELASVPIIAMTANAFEEDKKKAIETGMNAHIAKPIDVKELLDTLEKMLKS